MPQDPVVETRAGTRSSAPSREDASARKEQRLRTMLSAMDSAIVAFSGGVDSAYLSYVATMELGQRAVCVTADSASYSARHRELAERTAADLSLCHEIIRTEEMTRPEYRANGADRCFHCKDELFTHLRQMADARAIRYVLDGSNADDRGDYRPGREAARRLGVRSPLDEVDLSKAEIRELSRRAGLRVWDEPASACLSSRIPYHTEVTDERLRMVEQAEAVLRGLGLRVCRVRHHESVARLEVAPAEMERLMEPETRVAVARELRRIGYRFVTLDLEGYRTGSLNEPLALRPL